MMSTENRATFTFNQTNTAPIDKVFPLLCPVREKEWLDGWSYEMIFSELGLIEEGCIFSTPHHGSERTIWYVTRYDQKNFKIEFIRVTPKENVVKINIELSPLDENTTSSEISYQYTLLNYEHYDPIICKLEQEFKENMLWWEKALNHYLITGEMLKKNKNQL